jgi:hypothetical protein
MLRFKEISVALLIAALLPASAAVSTAATYCSLGLCDHHDAPAPLIGVGLPGLAVGLGVFWLIRQRTRRKID